jgi:hypothetical protein
MSGAKVVWLTMQLTWLLSTPSSAAISRSDCA